MIFEPENVASTITAHRAKGSQPGSHIDNGSLVGQHGRLRSLTPLECERLQGFPDDWTNIPGAAKTNRYRALGNAISYNVIEWIGERIQMVEDLMVLQ